MDFDYINDETMLRFIEHYNSPLSVGSDNLLPIFRSRSTMFDYATCLNEWGIRVILFLQQFSILGEGWVDTFWLFLTKFGDPNMVFVLYGPLMYPFSKHTAHEFLIAGAVSEFLNMVIKWILMGDRPFWWIHESGIYTNESMPALMQFEHTCETGPGNPSGHAMVTSCVWFVFLINIGKYSSVVLTCILWIVYAAVVFFIALSRLYIAAHFPHQLILGVLIGICIALIVLRYCRRVDFAQCSYLALCLFTLAMFVLLTALVNRVDLDWSIELAMRWCQNPSWIHVSTIPYTGLFRDLGALLGLGAAADMRRRYRLRHQHMNLARKIMWAVINVAFAISSTVVVFKVTIKPLFYALTFVQNFVIIFNTIFVVPNYMRNNKLEH